MIQQKSLEPHQVKDYQDTLKFFKESIGIIEPLRVEIPHSEINEELAYARKLGINEIGKGIIAKHALLSFFPTQIRDNPLLLLYVYEKLFKGESPLSKRSKFALHKYFGDDDKDKEEERRTDLEGEKYKLEDRVKKHSKLALVMLDAMDMMLPSQNVDFYFNNYLKQIIYWKDSLLKDDYPMMDKIMDNFWKSQNWNYTTEEYYMILELADLFDSTQKPFSFDFFQKYVGSNRESLLRRYGNYNWITNDAQRKMYWNKLLAQGVNFVYKINTWVLGLYPVHYAIQLHPEANHNLLKFCLGYIQNNYFVFSNRSQNSMVFYGVMYVPHPDLDFVNGFFERLRDMEVIIDFLVVCGKKYTIAISKPKTHTQNIADINMKIEWMNPNIKTIKKFDAFDNIILQWLGKIGFTGFPFDDFANFSKKIRKYVNERITSLEKRLKNIENIDNLKKHNSRYLELIIPAWFYNSEFTTLQEYLENSTLSNMENYFFLSKWHQILSVLHDFLSGENNDKFESTKKIENFESLREYNPTIFITIRNEMRSLKKFAVEVYNNLKASSKSKTPYSTKSLLNRLIQIENEEKIITEILENIKMLIFILKSELELAENDKKSIKKSLSTLKEITDLENSDLTKEFEKRLNRYLKYGIVNPNLLQSVILEELGYFDCWLIPSQAHTNAKDMIIKKARSMNFSIEKNMFFPWDLFYGSAKVTEAKSNWQISHVLKIPTASFFLSKYNILYHFDNLYDFSNKKFSSIRHLMRKVFEFSSIHLKLKSSSKLSKISDFIDLNRTSKELEKIVKSKSLKKNLKGKPLKSISKPICDPSEITHTFFKARDETTSVFLEPENTCMKDIQLEVNWPRIGLAEYVISFKIRKEKFSHKAISHPIKTREFLCVPGIKEIYSSTNSGYFQSTFIHFIFPFNSPPYNVFHSLERWNYIEDLIFMRVKSKKIWFNSQFLEHNIRGFNPWIFTGHKIVTKKGEMPGEFPLSIEYTPDQKITGPKSPHFQTIQSAFGKNLQRLKNLPIFKNIQKLQKSGIVWYLPEMNYFYPLPLRVIVQLYPLNSRQIKILNYLLTAVPLSIQYNVEFERENKRYEGLFVDLRFHICNISEIFEEIDKIVRYLKVENYRVIPSVVNITIEDFVGYKLKKYPDLFNSFIWKDNRFNNVKFLDRSGPLDYSERYKQLM